MPVRHGGTAHSEEHTFRRGEIRKLHAPVRTRRRCRLCGCGRQRQHLRFRRFADSPEHGFRAGAWHDDSTFVAVDPDPNTDKGVHEFAWNVVADASMPAVLDEANRLNAAVLPAMPAFDPLAQLNPVDGVMVLDWVKLADDGSGDLILRVYEAVGGEAHARLAVNAALGKATVRECSIMEDARLDAELPAAFADGDPSVARTAQGAMLSLHPFQLATLRVSCGSDGGNTDGNESGSLR